MLLRAGGAFSGRGKTYKEIIRNWTDINGTQTPETVFMATLPTIAEEARKIFQCPKLEGAELHKINKSGKWEKDVAHWSPRLFIQEILFPAVNFGPKILALTLAAIKETR